MGYDKCISETLNVNCNLCGRYSTVTFFPFLQVNSSDTENLARMVELWFVFSLIWSICASVDEDGRKKIDNFLREMEGTFPIKVLFET